ncbi:hypothetical protein OIU34_24820 [Pararhizobium sp. BT-229]|uniref:helix-turn-helix transcriptional regulator n=1 Tax=Pararhizobium sp. BT-229 TaxID=2986923 RepID=UPI0021F7629F|nr:hypothetical protein [Pararhizobium sp. BT-229]MCV9965109.1 hypothetical protein [Pararhizobium sp. BT-229]
MNFGQSRLNFQSWVNTDPAFVASYAEHFAHINPWTPYWSAAKSGFVALSEEVCPARLFANTEFYNDWLRPQKDAEAAAGLKLLGGDGETIQFVIHFPISGSETFGHATAEVLRQVRGNLGRSISIARLMRAGTEGAVAAAALVERSRCAAFVVDYTRSVREANQRAVQSFSSGRCVNIRNNRCFLANGDADARFGSALESLSRGFPTDGASFSFLTTEGPMQVTMAALPATASSNSFAALLSHRQLVLVLVTELFSTANDAVDLTTLRTALGLTPSEITFCQRLLLGESVSDAADRLGISVETARTRLKAIFQKTGTSRQGQLMLLLSKLR